MMIFLKAFLVMNTFGILILLILIVIKRYVAVYGEYTITINKEKSIKVTGGQPLSSILFKNDIFIPSACGGKGTCCLCTCKVTENISEPLSIEEAVLSYCDLKQGLRLTCQTKVRSDMEIEIPEEYLNVQRFVGEIVTITKLTHDIKRFEIKLKNPDEIHFKSGQYIMIEMESGETRAYSIASTKSLKDRIKLEIKKVPEGLCSTYLHGLKVSDHIVLYGPYGEFHLKPTQNRVICAAGGVGIASMWSIIHEALTEHTDRDVELYYGAHSLDDLYDYGYFIDMAKKYPNFTFYPCRSRKSEVYTDPETGYTFEAGVVNSVKKNFQFTHDSEVYLCGPPAFVDTVTAAFIEKGIKESRIHSDKF